MSQVEHLLHDLKELEAQLGVKESKRLDVNLMRRLIQRSDAFAEGCAACRHNLVELQALVEELKVRSRQESAGAPGTKEHQHKRKLITSHLKDDHKLVTEGHYTGIYMSLGVSLGLVFGLTIMDNVAIGLPIGLCLGLALGTTMDADARKKGNVL
ncbi:hypothetical protein MO973_01255 [Paenibacillus sp. TRM 82003]|nr:hypothetical protein [Paenibacillus sp. TRM 82003]